MININSAIVGGYFLLTGLVMIFLRSQVLEFVDGYILPWGVLKSIPRNVYLVIITVFGTLSAIGGIILVLLSILPS